MIEENFFFSNFLRSLEQFIQTVKGINNINSTAILEFKFNANEHIIKAYDCHIYLKSNAKGNDEFVHGNGKVQIPHTKLPHAY